MYTFWISVGLLVATVVLTIVIILLLSNLGAYFTKIAQGTTVFINNGDSLRSIWPNVSGYQMSQDKDLDGQQWLIPEEDEEEREEAFFRDSSLWTRWLQKLLWNSFGIRFISWFWPHNAAHSFNIRSRKRIKERNEIAQDAPLRSRVVDSPEPSTVVDSLLFTVPRPVFLEGVELAGDNSRINLLLLPIYRQVIPSLPVYNLKGDFFAPLDAAIEAAMVDFFASHRVAVYKEGEGKKGQFAKNSLEEVEDPKEREKLEAVPLTYSLWLQLTKGGEDSPIERQLRHLNASAEYREKLVEKGGTEELVSYIDTLTHDSPALTIGGKLASRIPSGIVPRFGFALVSFRVVECEAHQSTIKLAEALLAKETKRHEAEGVREQAYGKRDATEALGKGESDRFDRMVAALVKHKVDPNIAAQVVATQLRMENVRGSKLTTYVEGGDSRASIMVPAQASAPKTTEETV